jgi:hypothetical protein
MRFRFTIRDLLWLTALVAVALAGWFARQPAMPGRFQFIETRPGDGPWLLLDTATGQTWRDSGGAWAPDRPAPHY